LNVTGRLLENLLRAMFAGSRTFADDICLVAAEEQKR
jgi:hypothetical protein